MLWPEAEAEIENENETGKTGCGSQCKVKWSGSEPQREFKL